MIDQSPHMITDETGEIRYIGMHEDELDCWRVCLGWPTVGEVREKIRAGWTCRRVTVTPVTDVNE